MKHPNILRAAVLCAALLACRPAAARDIYVSVSGSDANPGTIDKPVATLFRVQGVLQAGDTVWLRGGAYKGGLRVRQPGVTIQGYPGEDARISLPNNDPLTNVLWAFKSGVTFKDLDISGGYYPIKFESYATGGKVLHCHVHHSGADAIKFVPLADGGTVADCEIDHTRALTPNGQGVDCVNCKSLTITRCYFHDIADVAIVVKGGAQYASVTQNTIMHCEIGVQGGQTTDRASVWANGFPGDNPNGVEFRDSTIQDNLIVDMTGSGISCWAAQRVTIADNVIVDVTTTSGAGINLQCWMIYPPVGLPHEVPCSNITIQGNMIRLRASSTRAAIYIQPRGLTVGTLKANGNSYYQPGATVQFWDLNASTAIYKGPLAGWASRMGEVGSMVVPQPPAGLSGPPVLPAAP